MHEAPCTTIVTVCTSTCDLSQHDRGAFSSRIKAGHVACRRPGRIKDQGSKRSPAHIHTASTLVRRKLVCCLACRTGPNGRVSRGGAGHLASTYGACGLQQLPPLGSIHHSGQIGPQQEPYQCYNFNEPHQRRVVCGRNGGRNGQHGQPHQQSASEQGPHVSTVVSLIIPRAGPGCNFAS
jgi:hypothetical protein